jgi:protein-disulfide isomerase
VRLVFKDFPLPSHKLAPLAHQAARCAGAVGQYWPYHDRLFAKQPEFDRDDLVRYAVELGLSRDAFVACLDSKRFAAAVDADLAQGRALGVRSTPSFLINGRPVIGAQPTDVFRTAIDEALAERR